MKVICYVRVSTREQAMEGYSVGSQTEKLKAYCKARGWKCLKVICDPGYSGGKLERPGIKEVIQMCEKKACDLVLVKKLDRLSRSQKDTLFLIEDVFLKNKIAFVSMEENFDTSSAFGRAMIGTLSVFAQLERDMIRERTSDGRVERAKTGLWHGGGHDPIGYDYIDGKLQINEFEALQVREIYDHLISDHWAVSKIWRYMQDNYTNRHGSWASSSAIYSVLQTPLYYGRIKYLDNEYEGQHEPLITEEQFKKAQDILDDPVRYINHKKDAFKVTKLLGGGMLRCAKCGKTFYARGMFSGHPPNYIERDSYVCYGRYNSTGGRMAPIDERCESKALPVCEVDYKIVMEIKKLAYDDAYLNEIIVGEEAPEDDKTAIIEKRLSEIDKQRARLLDLYQLGDMDITVIQDRLSGLEEERRKLEGAVMELKRPARATVPEVRSMLQGCNEIFEHGTIEERRALVHSLIEYIEIDDDRLAIHWTFA